MAKQKSPVVKLKGSIDDMSFYRTQDGFLAREKRSIDPERLKSDPAFANTRNAMAEFADAGAASKLLRQAYVNELSIASDGRVIGRSVRAMMRVLKSDAVNRRGARTVAIGDPTMLKGFEFNIAAPLDACLKAASTIVLNRATGQAAIVVPALVPTQLIAVPDMATHYRLFAAAASIDFGTGDSFITRTKSAELPWTTVEAAEVTLQLTLPAATTAPIFLALGIEYSAQTNGFSDPVAKNANAFKLIYVDKP